MPSALCIVGREFVLISYFDLDYGFEFNVYQIISIKFGMLEDNRTPDNIFI